jgi:uncharacterized membrane protein (UPF0182 family)
MSDTNIQAHIPIDPAAIRRLSGCAILVFSLFAIALVTLTSVGPYTDYLWFAHDVRHPEVFNKGYETKGILFVAAFVPTWILIYFSLRQAFALSLIYLRKPDSIGSVVVGNAVVWFQAKGGTVVRFAAPLVAFFTASQFSGEWNTYLLSTHAQAFGVKDPTFGMDLGFFVFRLPWYRAVSNYAFATLIIALILTVGLYVGLQALAALAKIELSRPHIRLHVALLVGTSLIVLGIQNCLKVFEAGFTPNSQFTGAGYSDMQGIGALRLFAILAFVGGAAVIAGWKLGRPNQVTATVAVALGAFYLLGVMIYPSLVQRFVVGPNRISRELPFAQEAIQMTRYAYGLDQIDVRSTDVQPAPNAREVAGSTSTLDNMRLWDPEIIRQSCLGLQAIRPYYTFNDVDVDRYDIGGKRTEVMLSPRDINIEGLTPTARNWTNDRLYYTHGYGVVVVPVNAATPDGRPDFLAQGIPQSAPPSMPVTEPRVYFSDFRDGSGGITEQYAIVRTGEPELDYQTQANSATVTHSWTGDRGVPIGGLLSRLAFSIALQDGNLLVSPKVGGESRILVHRNVLDRATRLYPFLQFDGDPCLVILHGRLIWILDAYTTSTNVPYSDRDPDDPDGLNYIRNSVKVTIDAYTGVVTAYDVQPNEPILKAYREIYPGLIRDISELPDGLRDHFRYPEDMFAVQSRLLAQYHVTDPRVFLTNDDSWQIAKERNLNGDSSDIRPYYVQMKLPDEPSAEFLLIRPFTPNGKSTMSGWLAAHSDPVDYGRLTLYRFVNQSPVAGPQLMEANFNSTPAISNINRQYQNGQSEILVGNLLVIPIGQSVLYVEPLYLKSLTTGVTGVPRLFRVVLALNDRVVVGETYKEALNDLLGAQSLPSTPATTAEPAPTATGIQPGQPDIAKVIHASDLLDQADQALRQGDFAKYGVLQKQAREILKLIVKK